MKNMFPFKAKDVRPNFLYKMKNIGPSYLHSLVKAKNKSKSPVILLPEKIGEFKLFSDLQNDKHYPFKIGLYQRSKKQIVAKIWEGLHKDLHYYDLVHEITLNWILTNVRKRVVKILPHEIAGYSTPGFLGVIREKSRIIFLSEYVSGSKLSSVRSDTGKFEYYQNCIKYLAFLGNHMTRHEKMLISNKGGFEYIIQFPFILTASLLKHWGKRVLIGKGAVLFIKMLPQLFKYNKFVLVHGDLNYDNIILSDNFVYILDFEQTVFTFPEYETICTLSSGRNSKPFVVNVLGSGIIETYKKHKGYKLFSGLMANCQIHNLIGNVSSENHNRYFKRIEMAWELSGKNKDSGSSLNSLNLTI